MTAFLVCLTVCGAAAPPPPDAGPPDREEVALRGRLWSASTEVDLGGRWIVRLLFDRSQEVTRELEVGRGNRLVGPTRPLWHPLRQIARRSDLRGLPFLDEHLDGDALAALARLSDGHRAALQAGGRGGGYAASDEPEVRRRMVRLIESVAVTNPGESFPGRLEQVVLIHPAEIRFAMVRRLEVPPSKEARRVLARRAAFDFAPVVRRAAVEALRDGPRDEARAVFLAALRHPWPSAADHAARALVELNDRAALPALREAERLPAPDEPYRDASGAWQQRGVARIDHLRNCMLCHPAAARDASSRHGVLGALQLPGLPLVREDGTGQQVLAHVVFLRPDLSALFDAEPPLDAAWPAVRRFDFVSYSRPLTDEERREHLVRRAAPAATYPQREAVRWAIRRLSGGGG